MRKVYLIIGIFLLSYVAFGSDIINKWNGVTTGASTGNVRKWNGKAFGNLSTGHLAKWDGFRVMSSALGGAAPSASTLSSVSNSPPQLTATWGTVSGATSYNLYLRAGSAPTTSTYDTKYTGVTSPYTINGTLTQGTTYYEGVTAVGTGGESVLSNTASAVAAAVTTYYDTGSSGWTLEWGGVSTSGGNPLPFSATEDGTGDYVVSVGMSKTLTLPASGTVSVTVAMDHEDAVSGDTLVVSIGSNQRIFETSFSSGTFTYGLQAADAGSKLVNIYFEADISGDYVPDVYSSVTATISAISVPHL